LGRWEAEGWKDKPAKLRQKDRDARWTVKYTKAKPREDGSTPPVDLPFHHCPSA
jgi:transposase, IS5 family